LYVMGEGVKACTAQSQESKVPRVCQRSELSLAPLIGRSLTIGGALLVVDGSFRCSGPRKPQVGAGVLAEMWMIRQSSHAMRHKRFLQDDMPVGSEWAHSLHLSLSLALSHRPGSIAWQSAEAPLNPWSSMQGRRELASWGGGEGREEPRGPLRSTVTFD
jgi:hypothetical protein